MRVLLPCLSLLLVAACVPPEPQDRVGGVGFENYGDYQRRMAYEAEARRAGAQPVQTVQGPVQNPVVPFPSAAGTGAPTAAELAQAGVSGAAVLAQTQPAPVVPQPYAAASATMPQLADPLSATVPPVAPPVNEGISDEQDFSAVSSRESIESDKQRIAENRAQYQQIQPTELPDRADAGNRAAIIEYALKAPNRLGESIYRRSSIALSNHERACARFATPEAAQEAFLKSGGPQRDPKNLDPDGDGFACFWDPTPFQKARG